MREKKLSDEQTDSYMNREKNRTIITETEACSRLTELLQQIEVTKI